MEREIQFLNMSEDDKEKWLYLFSINYYLNKNLNEKDWNEIFNWSYCGANFIYDIKQYFKIDISNEQLVFAFNKASNVALEVIKYFVIDTTQLDFRPLTQIRNLTSLFIDEYHDAEVENYKYVLNLLMLTNIKLEVLRIKNCRIKNINLFNSFNLKRVEIENTDIEDFSFLESSVNIEYLSLQGNEDLRNIAFVSNFLT